MPRMTLLRVEPIVTAISDRPQDVAAELVIVPFRDGDDLSDLDGLDAASGGEISRARDRKEFTGEANELFITPLGSEWAASRVCLVGVGTAGEERCAKLRTALATVAVAARQRRIGHLAVLLRTGDSDHARAALCQAAVEGLLLGGFDDRRFKTDARDASPVERTCQIVVRASELAVASTAVVRGAAMAEAANLARELANEPPNKLDPETFATRAAAMVSDRGVAVRILAEDDIRALGMGLILGVAQGSARPPRLLVMDYAPDDAPTTPVLGLVGKGVTFDSGGLSLKTSDGMVTMKQDMSGGAAVVGAMRAIGQIRPAMRCVGIVPMVENMPGGRAIRPGDVLTSAAGTSVEVLNTDAEGRLILADALWFAREQGVTHIVDVATLTGACVVALGSAASGLFGQPTDWVDAVRSAGAQAGERLWHLPLYDDYREQLKSETADLANIGGRPAGACTAAAFLQAFAGDVPWAHVDIAGTAWSDESGPDRAKGATGVLVRTLAELACLGADGWPSVEGPTR